MNTRIKRCITLTIALLSMAVASQAQNTIVHFGYDANGNRISRTLTVAKEEKRMTTDTARILNPIPEEVCVLGTATVSVYPNPVHDKLTVSLQGLGGKNAEAHIINNTGAVLLQRKLPDGVHNLDFSNLPAGVYLLQLTVSNKIHTWKIIKE